MRRIITALGLDNDTELTDKHFGDSAYFDIYKVTKNSMKHIKRLTMLK